MARSKVTPLAPGDQIEYSLTAELKHPRKGNWWCKVGGTTTVREGESAEAAKDRLRTFVHDSLDEAAHDILD